MSKTKEKKQYPENFRTLAGFFMTMFANTFSTMVLSILMIFLTDYSGIDSAMGKVGYAAAFGTTFLLLTRIVDAIDDPIQGWIVDSAKERRFGKYRRFGIIGTALVGVGAIMLFAIPGPVKSSAVLLWIWAIIGYLLFDMGGAMGSITGPLTQKSTKVPRIRAKIVSVLRMAAVVASIPALFFVTIVTVISGEGGNQGKIAVMVAVGFALVSCCITLIGIALLKEPYIETANEQNKGAVTFSQIIEMIKKNKPLWFHSLGFCIGNMSYGLASGVMLYVLKWSFSADLSTGEVNMVQFATLSGIYSIITLIPNFICPFLTTTALKIFKTVDKTMSSCMLINFFAYIILFILNLTGVLRAIPMLFFIVFFIIMIPSGLSAIFSTLLTVECADYAEYSTGRNMNAINNSFYGLANKAQSAIGGAIPGVLLVLVGYSVNSETGAFVGDLASLPGMATGLTFVAFLIPAFFAIISFLIYKYFYPITPQLRAKMAEELSHRRVENGEVEAEE